MSEPHKHHFIPQFYQRGFTPDRGSKIWVYQKGDNPRHRPVRSVGMQIDLYAFRRSGQVDFGLVERELALLDDQAAKIIQKLEAGRQITDKDRSRLCKFVSVMWRRTPKHRDEVNASVVDLIPDVFEPLKQFEDQMTPEVRAEVERLRKEYSEKPPDFVFAHNVSRDSNFEEVMYRMDWVFFRAPLGKEFFTSDDPVMFSKGPGLGSPKAIIAFPLSRKLLLQCMWKSAWSNRFHELEPHEVDHFNLSTVKNAHKQLLASQKSEDIRQTVDQSLGAWNSKPKITPN
jgi:Protein of unknown function (DUF4238)